MVGRCPVLLGKVKSSKKKPSNLLKIKRNFLAFLRGLLGKTSSLLEIPRSLLVFSRNLLRNPILWAVFFMKTSSTSSGVPLETKIGMGEIDYEHKKSLSSASRRQRFMF